MSDEQRSGSAAGSRPLRSRSWARSTLAIIGPSLTVQPAALRW